MEHQLNYRFLELLIFCEAGLQGPPGASRGLQGPPGASMALQGPSRRLEGPPGPSGVSRGLKRGLQGSSTSSLRGVQAPPKPPETRGLQGFCRASGPLQAFRDSRASRPSETRPSGFRASGSASEPPRALHQQPPETCEGLSRETLNPKP